uniref:Uncharacterized protein n=1 Tax=Helicotheca tamesis TaxID=374047 RepID=A0A7S2MD84_9STRA
MSTSNANTTSLSSSLPSSPSKKKRNKSIFRSLHIPQRHTHSHSHATSSSSKSYKKELKLDPNKPTKLYTHISNRDWKSASARLQKCPHEAAVWTLFHQNTLPPTINETSNHHHPQDPSSSSHHEKEEYGCHRLPLHKACTLKPPLPFLQSLYSAYTDAITSKEKYGMLPLHVAIQNGASHPIISFLLQHHKDAASTPDNFGLLPLHLACTEGASVNVVTELLRVYPMAMEVCDERGRKPVDYVRESCFCPNRNVLLEVLGQKDVLYWLAPRICCNDDDNKNKNKEEEGQIPPLYRMVQKKEWDKIMDYLNQQDDDDDDNDDDEYEEDDDYYYDVEEEYILVTFLEDGFTTWLPARFCSHMGPNKVWEAGPFMYSIWYNSKKEDPPYSEFHRAFSDISNDFVDASPALFTYWQGRTVVEPVDEQAEVFPFTTKEREGTWAEVERVSVDPRLTKYMQSEYPGVPVYHSLPRHYTMPIDDKYTLFELYQNDELAASVFPPTYGTIESALDASQGDEHQLFFLKDRGASQGLGIRILSRQDLLREPRPPPDQRPTFVIQKAIEDVMTINTIADKPLLRRRFDIRYFFIVVQGNVYLHSNMYAMLSTPRKPYDPKDPSLENHVPKVSNYVGEEAEMQLRDFIYMPTTWENNNTTNTTEFPSLAEHAQDLRAWQKSIAVSLSKARSVLAPLIDATMSDPFSYHLIGGDAIIERSSGRAILVEFNDWPDYSGFNKQMNKCLTEQKCVRRVLVESESRGNYTTRQASPEFYAVYSGYTAQIFEDMVKLVMGLQSPESLERFREVKEWKSNASFDAHLDKCLTE